MLLIFGLLFTVLLLAGTATKVRPRTARDWALVWSVLVFLAWALVGSGWVRSV